MSRAPDRQPLPGRESPMRTDGPVQHRAWMQQALVRSFVPDKVRQSAITWVLVKPSVFDLAKPIICITTAQGQQDGELVWLSAGTCGSGISKGPFSTSASQERMTPEQPVRRGLCSKGNGGICFTSALERPRPLRTAFPASLTSRWRQRVFILKGPG